MTTARFTWVVSSAQLGQELVIAARRAAAYDANAFRARHIRIAEECAYSFLHHRPELLRRISRCDHSPASSQSAILARWPRIVLMCSIASSADVAT